MEGIIPRRPSRARRVRNRGQEVSLARGVEKAPAETEVRSCALDTRIACLSASSGSYVEIWPDRPGSFSGGTATRQFFFFTVVFLYWRFTPRSRRSFFRLPRRNTKVYVSFLFFVGAFVCCYFPPLFSLQRVEGEKIRGTTLRGES